MDVNELGSWSSIIGLFVSLLVLFYSWLIANRVKKIKNKIQTNEILPKLIDNLKKNNFKLLREIDEYGCNIDKIPVTLEIIRANLKSSRNKVSKKIKTDIDKIQTQLEHLLHKKLIPTGTNNKKDIRAIYFKIHFIIERLELYIDEFNKTERYD